MRFCQDHWDRLRAAIDERGLSHLIAPDGETAVAQIKQELEQGPSAVTFDPLMSAHWAIVSNAMDTITRAGASPLYLMTAGPEDPVEGYGPAGDGRTWPRCPLCYLNLAHELTCKDPRCTLPKVGGYDWMIERAADDQAQRAAELGDDGRKGSPA